jgi:hypothetical protein
LSSNHIILPFRSTVQREASRIPRLPRSIHAILQFVDSTRAFASFRPEGSLSQNEFHCQYFISSQPKKSCAEQSDHPESYFPKRLSRRGVVVVFVVVEIEIEKSNAAAVPSRKKQPSTHVERRSRSGRRPSRQTPKRTLAITPRNLDASDKSNRTPRVIFIPKSNKIVSIQM